MSKKNINSVTVFSPGRINLIGEHIDYNGGNVLPAAINRKLNLNFNKNSKKGILLPEINIHMRKKIEVTENKSINFFFDKSLKKNKAKIANKLNF